MIHRRLLCCMATFVGLSIPACNSTIAPSNTAKATSATKFVTSDESEDVESVIQQYEDLGKKYNGVLADDKQSAELRGRAADFLGRMKYVPAIPTLIQHLTLADFKRFRTGDDLESLVCFHALLEYGDLAIPGVINAYLVEPDPIKNVTRKEDERRLLLLIVIDGAKKRTANLYFQGLAATNDVRLTKAKLTEWNDRIDN